MNIKTLGSYGGPFENLTPVTDPVTEVSADQINELLEDVAQLTHTRPMGIVKFNTHTLSTAVAVSVVGSRLLWGEGVSYYPTVAKTGTGVYTITLDASYEDGLENAEIVSMFGAHANVKYSATVGHAMCGVATNVATVKVFNASGSASDLGGSEVTAWLY